MSLNFTAVNTLEHDNGAALGSLSHENATVGSFKYYHSDESDLFYVANDILYLGANWHYDFEKNEYRKFADDNNWSTLGVGNIAVKYRIVTLKCSNVLLFYVFVANMLCHVL